MRGHVSGAVTWFYCKVTSISGTNIYGITEWIELSKMGGHKAPTYRRKDDTLFQTVDASFQRTKLCYLTAYIWRRDIALLSKKVCNLKV